MQYVEKFKKFIKDEELYFDDITVTMLKDYINYMSNNLKNGATTIHYSIRILSLMFKEAARVYVIPESLYPFSKVQVKRDKGKRLFLNKEQLEQLKNFKLEYERKDEVFRNMFFFAVYAGVFRFSHVVTLKWENFNPKKIESQKPFAKQVANIVLKLDNKL